MINPTLWWGYKHADGSLHLKEYNSREEANALIASPFILKVCPPFYAYTRQEAEQILEGREL